MDINTIRGFSSVLMLLAFAGICWWAFSPKRRKQFDEAANLPFQDELPKDEVKDAPSNNQKQDKR